MSTAASSHRLAAGGLIDRSRTLRLSFDGLALDAHPGDTLASALVANGVRLVGRSFKYHRPRGILTAGPEEPNALVELRHGGRHEPNTRATTAEAFDGLVATSQNRWPSLRFDMMSVTGHFGPMLGAGFYYKTFKWPAAFWERLYEPLIRRAAGLGSPPMERDPDLYERATAHCDVLVVGSGAAGLTAALVAARRGLRVVLAETDFILGGGLLIDSSEIDGQPAVQWVQAAEAELTRFQNVRILRRTSVFGSYDHGSFGALERVNDHVSVAPPHQARQRNWRIVAKRMLMATGATERPIVFSGNDLPGVMLAGAVRAYIERFAAVPGRRAAVFTTNDDGWRTVVSLRKAGVEIAAIVDARATVPASLVALAEGSGAQIIAGTVTAAKGGRDGVRQIAVARHGGGTQVVACDLLAVSGGWNPNIALASHQGSKPVWDATRLAFLPGQGLSRWIRPVLADTVADALRLGHAAGAEAASDFGGAGSAGVPPKVSRDTTPRGAPAAPLWEVAGHGKAFVDFQNDVTADDIKLAQREGYDSVELAKRYTTLGMATDQGKTSNVNGLAILAAVAGRDIPEVGTTMFRPPVEPVTIGAVAGAHAGPHLKPTRITPSHAWALENGGSFIESGLWLRAQWYTRPGERDWLESCNREVRAVRTAVGVCDVSTLGKIEIHGPDAGTFLDRVYTNTFSTLAVGRARYGLMLREDGFVMDDGTTSRLGERHFVMTTTTANAGRVMQHLEFARQVLWPDLNVQIASVSEQWAQFSIAGPNAHLVIAAAVDSGHDVTPAGLPFMGVAQVSVLGGVPARLFRISYSGERAYEIAVPSRMGDAMIRHLMACGQAHGITPFGLEAMNVLRIEKGHVAGNEINGQTTARDLGLESMMSKRKDFIGRTLAARPGLLDPDRWRLAGFKPLQHNEPLKAGAHFLPLGAPASADFDQGYMTSVCYSPTFGHAIGLGLIARGHERIGERVRAVDPVRGGDVVVEIVAPAFYDADGGRQRG